jgi:hypothetical protein
MRKKNVHGDQKSVKNVHEKFGGFCPSALIMHNKNIQKDTQ